MVTCVPREVRHLHRIVTLRKLRHLRSRKGKFYSCHLARRQNDCNSHIHVESKIAHQLLPAIKTTISHVFLMNTKTIALIACSCTCIFLSQARKFPPSGQPRCFSKVVMKSKMVFSLHLVRRCTCLRSLYNSCTQPFCTQPSTSSTFFSLLKQFKFSP